METSSQTRDRRVGKQKQALYDARDVEEDSREKEELERASGIKGEFCAFMIV